LPGASHLGGQAWNLGVDVPNEALLKSVIGDFRLLYTDTNRSSAMRVLKILERSAYERGTPTGRAAIEALKEIRNGEYFHDGQEFAAELEPGDDLGVGMLRLTLHTAIRDHVYAWIVIRKTTSELLDAYPEV